MSCMYAAPVSLPAGDVTEATQTHSKLTWMPLFWGVLLNGACVLKAVPWHCVRRFWTVEHGSVLPTAEFLLSGVLRM